MYFCTSPSSAYIYIYIVNAVAKVCVFWKEWWVVGVGVCVWGWAWVNVHMKILNRRYLTNIYLFG